MTNRFETDSYGHFLVGTLARLWMIPRLASPRPRIVCWGDDLDTVLSQDFVTDILAQIGLTRDDFISFSTPTRVREIIVAETSFEENHYVHDIYGRFMRRIADGLTGGVQSIDNTPVYITKSKLGTGTTRIVNENEFIDHLSQLGVDIFFPEQHSIAVQVSFWQSHSLISGFLGSAMLTSAFAGRKNLAILNHESQVYSNQVLSDRLNNSVVSYKYPYEDIIPLPANKTFQLNFELRDPRRTAEEFIRVIDSLQNGPSRTGRRNSVAKSVCTVAYVDGPLGINLSRNRPARMSSILPPHSRRNSNEGEAGGAVDGTLDFTYGFHSDLQQDPWWSVDLGEACDIHEVRLFNRIDLAAGNSARLRILVSTDEANWLEVDRRESDSPFGGKDGRPYRWQPDRPLTGC